jgi:hypothetical protein
VYHAENISPQRSIIVCRAPTKLLFAVIAALMLVVLISGLSLRPVQADVSDSINRPCVELEQSGGAAIASRDDLRLPLSTRVPCHTSTPPKPAAFKVTGKIYDAVTGLALSSASVSYRSCYPRVMVYVTRPDGSYEIPWTLYLACIKMLKVSAIGYETQELPITFAQLLQQPVRDFYLTPRATSTPTPTPTSTSVPPQAGLVIKGYVRLADGSGLANVKIYRAFASYPGVVVATTDQTGYYQSNFQPIPGDEMVRVWAELSGYAFGPADTTVPWEQGAYYWRHYHGYEEKTLGFTAQSTVTPTYTPTPTSSPTSVSPQPGLVIKGYVRLADGTALTNVKIYRAFAAYPGVVVATTDQTGYYQSDFQPIPGDETVRVWAELSEYTIIPLHMWRHYYGYEVKTLDFNAQTGTPPPPTRTPTRRPTPSGTPTPTPTSCGFNGC